jgi:hypothetical protein
MEKKKPIYASPPELVKSGTQKKKSESTIRMIPGLKRESLKGAVIAFIWGFYIV